MKPIINAPIPPDFNVWLKVFPGLKVAYAQLKEDLSAGKKIVPETYYKLAGDKNTTGHHVSILAIRMAVLIWVETGQIDPVNFVGHYWSHGDLLKSEDDENETIETKTALVIIGTNKDQPGALIYINEDKILRWETPSDENEFQKVEPLITTE